MYSQILITIQIFLNLELIIKYEMYRFILYRFRMGPNVDRRWNGLTHWIWKWIGCLVKNDFVLLYTTTRNTLYLQKYHISFSCKSGSTSSRTCEREGVMSIYLSGSLSLPLCLHNQRWTPTQNQASKPALFAVVAVRNDESAQRQYRAGPRGVASSLI